MAYLFCTEAREKFTILKERGFMKTQICYCKICVEMYNIIDKELKVSYRIEMKQNY